MDLELELLDGYRIRATDSPASPIVERFFAGYDRAFILPDEREELGGFIECLSLNQSPLASAYGRRHREVVAVLEAASGELLGGANFFSTRMTGPPPEPPVSINLNYVFVESAARGHGHLRRILLGVEELARRVHGVTNEATPLAIFIEQNDPLRLTEEEHQRDAAHSGTDRLDRLAIWARLGARLVDLPYVQPALSPDRAAETGLLYGALSYPGPCIPARYLHDHWQSFFGISVLKGRPLEADKAASSQLEALAHSSECIALLPFDQKVRELRALSSLPSDRGFLEWARGAGTA